MSSALHRLRTTADKLTNATANRDQAILDARAEGATWEQVADAARMSRAGAIKAAQRAAGKNKTRE